MQVLQDLMLQSEVAFGTSGARGLVSSMSDEVCAAYTQAFISTISHSFTFKQVAIAIDLRPSSPRIAEACAKMVQQLGLEVIFCGAIPTPALALFSQQHALPGIMVTGSHIPFDRNGLKFYRPDGEITKSDEASMLACQLSPLSESGLACLPAIDTTARQAYMQRYIDFLGKNALEGLKLALYQHSSVGRDVMFELFTDLGAEVICLERSDIFVPIDTEAVSAQDIQRGLDWASTYHVDAIISTDGDGDRPLISDEQGRWLRGDIVGLLTARALQISHLAVPVSCNTAIEASNYFQKVIRTRIGSPFVIAAMADLQHEAKSLAGFEANGGFLLGSSIAQSPTLVALPTRDAILPVVTLLAQCKKTAKPLSELVAELPQRFTSSDRVQKFPTEKSKTLLLYWSEHPERMQNALKLDGKIAYIDTTDGLRISLESGQIVHLRPSGNAPEFRCYVEDNSQLAANTLLENIMQELKKLS